IGAVPAKRRGAATATYFIAMDAGIGLGSFILGLVAGWWGYRSIFLAGSLFVLASMAVYRWARGISRKEEGERKAAEWREGGCATEGSIPAQPFGEVAFQ